MNVPRGLSGSLGDFVPGRFPEPNNPIYRPNWDPNYSTGVGDFVPARFPEPVNPITGMAGLGRCHCGGSCGGCGGMGALTVPSWAASLPAPLSSSWGGVPVVYWGLGGLAAVLILPAVLGGGRGRRR